MAFTYNANDIKAAPKSKVLEYGGDYLVKVQSAKYQGKEDNPQNKQFGADKFHVVFEVLDEPEKGATIHHFFVDDSSITTYKPFRYREINAMFAGIGGMNDGVAIELSNVAQFLPEKVLSIRVNEFEKKNINQGKTVFNPVIADFSKPIKESVPDKSNPRPNLNGAETSINNFDAGSTPSNAATPFDNAPAADPFA
ncbi:DUF669 domain-containing protein [Weissella confusa]|uniref:DUF669 domain-containing protein n=1 Tax=Weissella confusa TaxID=1583 RepID=UPI00223BEB3F|nr:DUF669 domain-containing protein [Weissella confusa]MCT0040333.1 hypothetical protein [Weissella confusa]